MPYELLERLAHAELPLLIHATEEIDKVLILDAAKLVRARLPPSRTVSGLPRYAGPAKVLNVTPRGLEVLKARRG